MQLDPFVEGHLDLQVKLSYPDHHDFLLRHRLESCSHVLDVGTGNGTFVARLAQDHPGIQFTGIDKRRPCIESCKKIGLANFEAEVVDMFSSKSNFDFSRFDGFLMRYFLLHVDHAQKILDLIMSKAKPGGKVWIIDLDWSQFKSEPKSEGFDQLTSLVRDFCSKISVATQGGQNVVPLLKSCGYKNIQVEHIPFSSHNLPLEELSLYLKQEILCYSRMMGRAATDPETHEIIRFIDEDVSSGRVKVSYGMSLITANL